MSKRKVKYFGYLGFLGFTGFKYLTTGNPVDLSGFCFFSFFAYFWIANLTVNIPDERYFENVQKAKAFIGNLALLETAALLVVSILFFRIQELLVLGIAVVFASLILAYAIKLYQLEEM